MRRRDQAPVGFELGFTRPAQPDTALLPLEVGPAAHQARRYVLELGKLDLQLAFEGARALREDVQDQAAAIQHAAIEFLLEVAFLAGRERIVHDHQVGSECDQALAQFLDLSGAQEEARLRRPAGDRYHLEHLRTGRASERAELCHAIRFRRMADADADKNRAFAATRPVEQWVLSPRVGASAHSAGASSGGSSSSPMGRRTLRAGTMVDIACL